MNHTNANNAEGHWVGFGMPAKEGDDSYTYLVGAGDDAPAEVASIAGRTYKTDGKTYNTVYFSEDSEADFDTATYKIQVKDGETLIATYNVTFNVTFWKPADALVVRAFDRDELKDFDAEKNAAAGAVVMSAFALDTTNGKNTYSGTLNGEVDREKLVHVAAQTENSGPAGYYTYYALTMASLNDRIAKLHDVNGGLGFDMAVTADFGAVMASLIFSNDDTPAAQNVTHQYQLLDAAGRVQYEFEVSITNSCTLSSPSD